ncbi:uncharacterized protein [Choristoneura fumiferana]|uniref:uncharacterized protein n=1 Tax=Choristoneura fumiferana TaxID=7141 RepID=UPI003D1573ED
MEIKIFIVILTLSCAIFVIGYKKLEEFEDGDEESPPEPRDISDKYYDSLIKELPELVNVLAEYTARRNAPAYKESIRYWQKLPSMTLTKKHRIEDNTNSFDNPMIGGRRIYQTEGTDKNGKLHFGKTPQHHAEVNNFISKKTFYYNKRSFPVANCYWCGMNMTFFVPTNSLCHDAFESADYRLRSVQRFFRGKCYYTNPIYVLLDRNRWRNQVSERNLKYHGNFQGWNNFVYGSYCKDSNGTLDRKFGTWGAGYYFDYGLKKNYFGQYTGGCFKRYLDVGNIYTQRGCRHYWPKNSYGLTPMGHRFKRLELILRFKKEGCISTNHASLVPFNRGISLFARFHVCVCSSKYCNRAANSAHLSKMLLSAAVVLICRFNIRLNWIN